MGFSKTGLPQCWQIGASEIFLDSSFWRVEIVVLANLNFFSVSRKESLCFATSFSRVVNLESELDCCFWRIVEDLRSDFVWSFLILSIWVVRVVSVLEKDFIMSCSCFNLIWRSFSDFSSSEIRPR